MPLLRFHSPSLSINSFLLFDEKVKQGVVIDPIRDVEPYIQYAKENKIEITDILETHVHADFVSGAKELKTRLEGKPKIHCSGMGGTEWTPLYADHIVKDQDEFIIGSLRLQAWHTPGHTPEHLMWVVYDEARVQQSPWIAFTGDLIFVGSLGRPDLLGEKSVLELSKQMYHSIFGIVSKLPDFVEIFPAHGAGSLCGKEISNTPWSSLGYERRYNPGLTIKNQRQWMTMIQENLPAVPHYFNTLKKINVKGPAPMPSSMPKTLTDLNEATNCFLLDVRNPEDFAQKHISGSVNIPWGTSFPNWTGAVAPCDTPIVLILNENSHLRFILSALRLIGYDHISGYIDINALKTNQWVSFPMIAAEALHLKQTKDSLYILDVRTEAEWNESHIKEAHHIELNRLSQTLPQIPKKTPIVVLCGKGNRASIAASLLTKNGFQNVSNVRGGMHAWKQAQLPLITG